MNCHLTRRTFLRQAALAPATLSLAAGMTAPGAAAPKSPNQSLNVAVIGVSRRGGANLAGVSTENIVALCDVDAKNLAGASKQFPKAATFRDFRKMFDEVADRIDAAVVSTPDHCHAPAAAAAMRLKKHCYCEKPLAHTVAEVRVLTELSVQNGLATQMGTQIHAEDNYRRVVELVQSGAIGPVREVHVWHPGALGGQERPTDTPPVPDSLDWDLWLGPAPHRPYHPVYVPGKWRSWWDFGNGTLGDFGCHYMDLPFWALKLAHAVSVEAVGPAAHPETTSPQLTVRYEFPARGDLPPVRLTWTNGHTQPEIVTRLGLQKWAAGVLFVGQNGMLVADYGKRRLLPEKQFDGFSPPEPSIPDSIGHHAEWIQACKTGAATTCPFSYSGVLAETVLLGNVSYRSGAAFQWDAKNLKATNCPQAEPFLRRQYRSGWTL
ncbi:MAG: Gfo/Idh/MocA family protein [Thermoguttaceae bacterium]